LLFTFTGSGESDWTRERSKFSGAQSGWSLVPGPLERLVGVPLPSAFITQMSKSVLLLKGLSLLNAIFVPSGDHEGVSSSAETFVRLTGSFFGFARSCTQISRSVVPSAASRLRVNATFVPSGEKVGSVSVDVWFVIWAWFAPSAFITQISRSTVPSGACRLLVKAIFAPSDEKAGFVSAPETLVSLVWADPSAFMV
jgi:hypothetical protein